MLRGPCVAFSLPQSVWSGQTWASRYTADKGLGRAPRESSTQLRFNCVVFSGSGNRPRAPEMTFPGPRVTSRLGGPVGLGGLASLTRAPEKDGGKLSLSHTPAGAQSRNSCGSGSFCRSKAPMKPNIPPLWAVRREILCPAQQV